MKRVWQCYRSIVGGHIEDFLAHKRGTGRKFDSEERALQLFDRFIFEKRLNSINEITSALIEEFLKSRPRPRPRSFNHLLCTISRLFDWMMNRGITPFSPVQAFPRRQGAERRPYIFDLPKAQLLIEAAKKLPDNPRAPMRGPTYHAIFAILYGLGLRVGEVCRLRVKDLDFERRLLVVRRSKFYKSRLVPFGPKMATLLQDYVAQKTPKEVIISEDCPLFSFTNRGEIHPCTVSQVFHRLVPKLGLQIQPRQSAPRLHDLRHSFAVGTLIRWYRSGKNPGSTLLQLSTFLGHVDISSTAVYLQMTSELLTEANLRFEAYATPAFEEELI